MEIDFDPLYAMMWPLFIQFLIYVVIFIVISFFVGSVLTKLYIPGELCYLVGICVSTYCIYLLFRNTPDIWF